MQKNKKENRTKGQGFNFYSIAKLNLAEAYTLIYIHKSSLLNQLET